ncbi:MAG: HD domain-containing protein, partial [Oscillospiraceae bacterium]|nr:HD domain-containing protein [Oscillospiraceae bacterium]
IATDTGMLVYDEEWNSIENELTAMFDGIRVRCLVSDNSSNVWIASYSDSPVVCYNTADGTITAYNSETDIVGDKARVVAALSDGRIAAGTQTGVTIIENGVVAETYTYDDGLEIPSVLCLYDGENGSVLMGSDGAGIYELKDGTVKNYGFADVLEEGVVLRMMKSKKGGWFVSAGSSLYYWSDGKFTRLKNFIKSAGSIFDLYEIDNMLWILQNNGFIAMDIDQLLSGEQTDILQHDLSHGLSGSVNANTWHWLSPENKLYMSTRNGVSIFGFAGVAHKLPKMLVNRITVDGVDYEHPEEISIASNAQRITIDFSALSYVAASERRISYILKGFDKNETVISDTGGVVSYTNLPGGQYTFEASVYSLENPDEKVVCSLRIIKPKRIFEQPVFWVLMALLVALASAGIVMIAMRVKTKKIRERQQEYKRITEQSLRTFAKTIDAKDSYTNGHSIRVAEYAKEIAKRMGKSKDEQENIYYVALLHDIGKIGIPDNILNKPGKLTDEEREIIQRHVDIGEEILAEFTDLEGISDGVKYHHERFDGHGYCMGLKGKDIPEVARIICVADTYDAMSSDRCYRKALSNEIIYEELKTCSGSQFDPEIVPHMLNMIDEGIVPFRD